MIGPELLSDDTARPRRDTGDGRQGRRGQHNALRGVAHTGGCTAIRSLTMNGSVNRPRAGGRP